MVTSGKMFEMSGTNLDRGVLVFVKREITLRVPESIIADGVRR